MNKIEKIRAEIDRRYNEYSAKKKTDDFIYYSGMADALDLFEQFLDTLEEEPDKSLDEAAERFARFYDQGTCDGIIQDGFIAGAEWQKEQMLKEAVEGEAEELYNDGESQCTVGVGTYFKPGERVYVLKAMEDEE